MLPGDVDLTDGIVASDASQIGVCSYSVARAGSVFFQDSLSEEETRRASGSVEDAAVNKSGPPV